jgi:hypothetical protein
MKNMKTNIILFVVFAVYCLMYLWIKGPNCPFSPIQETSKAVWQFIPFGILASLLVHLVLGHRFHPALLGVASTMSGGFLIGSLFTYVAWQYKGRLDIGLAYFVYPFLVGAATGMVSSIFITINTKTKNRSE